MSIFRLKCSDVDTLVYAFRRASTLHSVFHQFHSKSTPTIRLGVLRESKSVWERRVPIVPDLIPPLLNAGAQVLMQPSSHRAISDDQFHKAGSIITEDLSSADIIIGIKEVPSSMLLPNKIYLFFSHTHKGQSKNMGMLKEIIEKKITLIDYELITDAHGKRTVAFGTYAGYAGMIDSLHILGRRMLALGYNSPFLQISMAHSYPSLNHARQSLDYLGKVIQKEGLPSCFAPFVVTFTGNGNVTSGAMSIFKHFPHQFLKVTDLPSLFRSKKHNPHCLYAVQAKHLDYLFDSEASFDEIKYRKEPHAFQSEFHSKIAPYTSLLVTGHFWNANYPRLLTSTQAAALSHHWKKHFRMLTIADISCDIEVDIDFFFFFFSFFFFSF
ncbi:hypothetical protein HMI55_003616 [Coelomomyces lativittatus]|nr:hypothetical protein HMI55_003616 [Coelomomyces lativittatus]